MPVTLYRRQKQILNYLVQYIQLNGFSPTLSEIAHAIDVSSLATVHEHLVSMTKKGVIRRMRGAIRGIEIADERFMKYVKSLDLPVLGLIAAGAPIEPMTDPHATVSIPLGMITGRKNAFALQVKGNSMIEEGILDGDYVIIEQQDDAKNGDIVVAVLENGFATLKKFYRETTRVRLEPANAQMAPIFATNVRIQGRAVGVIRRYPVS